MRADVEKIRDRLISLIDSRSPSDAALERALHLAEKTVNNWRRGRSSSFMGHLPALADYLGVTVGELMELPIGVGADGLSEDERELLALYRKTHSLPKKMRSALRDTIEATINMYLAAKDSRPRAGSGEKSKQGGLDK